MTVTHRSITRLLAKRSLSPEYPADPESLPGHTSLVLGAANKLLCARGEASLRAIGVSDEHREALNRIVRLAAFIHDLGKSSDHFQSMVRGEREEPQLLRHEALSLWLCWPGQPLSAWLRAAVESDLEYVLALIAAAGHHRKFWENAVAPADAGAGTHITLLASHEDFLATLQVATSELKLNEAPRLAEDITLTVTRQSDPRRCFEDWEAESNDRVPLGSEEARLLAVAKALVIAADVAGSALSRSSTPTAWIPAQLRSRASRDDLSRIVSERLAGYHLRPFQEAVARSSARMTLVAAGCGTGKTIAAYQWAAEQHAGRQLWVTYPTTGTATEGFRDYAFDVDAVTSRLEHSRREVDLEIFSLDDGAGGARERDRLDAIRVWGCDVVTCTVDTVLGLIQNQRKGLYAWPGMSHAAVVFDEVHAYDDQLFGSLLRFLEALPGIPALLMTATLPTTRLDVLRRLARRVHGCELPEITGPAEIEGLPRYRLETAEDPSALVRASLESGGKVLWVSNTVARCVALAKIESPVASLIYHSRFRYIDRVRRHGELINAFRSADPALALTTQVAEISLDLSADLLITDLAPIPALIQRLGRLNRRSEPARPQAVKPFVVLPFRGLPYEDTDLVAARRWLALLAGRELSQRDLIEAWRQDEVGPTPEVASAWLDGRFLTEPGPCREASPGLSVILEEDADRVRRGSLRPAEVVLPMNPPPDPRAWQRWPQLFHFPVAPSGSIAYDPSRGGEWRRL